MEQGRAPKPGWMTAVASTASVVIAWLILVRIWDAPLGSSLLYLGFLAGWVILPGVLIYRALVPDPGGPLRQLAIGCALGYVLGAFAFMITAAAGIRPVLDFYPLIAGIPAGFVIWLRWRAGKAGPDPEAAASGPMAARLVWAIAGVAILAMTVFALGFFPDTPLPGAKAVVYFQDYSWHISLIGEALNHWPMQEPSEVGEAVPYLSLIHI